MSITIDIARQELRYHAGSNRGLCVPISSGLSGTGTEEGSGRTPLGRFRIASKHGENAPRHTIFVARLPIGTYPEDCPKGARECILSRILTLDGCDEHNANTMARYIYIHGTSDVSHIGQPASLGCIRLRPDDMVALYALVHLGEEVVIQ